MGAVAGACFGPLGLFDEPPGGVRRVAMSWCPEAGFGPLRRVFGQRARWSVGPGAGLVCGWRGG